jgi:hypothetical protein
MAPTAGLRDQETAVLDMLVMLAVNVWVCEDVKVAVAGVSEIAMGGLTVRVAVADLVVSATLVALTVTVWVPMMVAGAV